MTVPSPRVLTHGPIVLGSGSPRRREILTNLRVPFVVHASAADESTRTGEAVAAYLERIVLAKLDGVAQAFAADRAEVEHVRGASAILVADTSVVDGGAILGKPTSTAEAEAMVARLAGRTHEVWTRFAIASAAIAPSVLHAETVVTRVTFRSLTQNQVHAYAESLEGADKAGGYAVQGYGAAFISRIDGSYTNVVGLPACELMTALERLGIVK